MTRAGRCLAAGLFAASSLAWPAASAAEDPAPSSAAASESARDLDPETLAWRLSAPVERDAADAVLRLLDVVDVEDLAFEPLHEAARHGSPRAAEALLAAGFDANAVGAEALANRIGTTRPLHVAARNESTQVAALLIEHGAEIEARDGGWTPLHHALLSGVERPALRTANLLLEHGADVNAATRVMGWTPLHLAARLDVAGELEPEEMAKQARAADVFELVQALVERGADVNARTRIGGWTPARVARKSHGRPGRGGSSSPALSALLAAGGRDEGCDNAPMFPVYAAGVRNWRSEWEQRRADPASGCEYDLPFAVPGARDAGGWKEPGSFTAPGAEEALLFENIGVLDGYNWFKLAGLQDRHGAVRPIMAFDHYMQYQGLCLDAETATHTAVFTRSYDGACCAWTDAVYYHYDANAGTLAEVFAEEVFVEEGVEDSLASTDEACRWRDRIGALAAYEDALDALRVGEPPSLTDDGAPGLLPVRVVPTEVAESQLKRLRALPEVALVRQPELESPRWKVAVAEYVGDPRSESVDVCESVLLVWDEARQEWRSIYDCAELSDIEIHGSTLSAALYSGEPYCGIRRLGRSCYLEVDLTTHQARLWDEPHGNDWSNRRERPSR